VKRIYYFGAGVALGVAATRRTRRAKEAARQALKAKVTPSAIPAHVAQAQAARGNAVRYKPAELRPGVLHRRARYPPIIDNGTGAVVLVGSESVGPPRADPEAGAGQPAEPQRRAPGAPAQPRPARRSA